MRFLPWEGFKRMRGRVMDLRSLVVGVSFGALVSMALIIGYLNYLLNRHK